jgi:hypothetical protein
VSADDIERLVAERSLARGSFDEEQVAGFWAKAVGSFRDAQVPGISPDGALQLAYTAGLQATFAVLASRGLRVKSSASHYKAFYALQKLDQTQLRRYAASFDELRAIRHESIYEPAEDEKEIAARVVDAIETLGDALPAIRAWLVLERPTLAPILTPMEPTDGG